MRHSMAVANISVQIAHRLREEINRIADVEQLSVSETIRSLLDNAVRTYREEKGLESGTY